MLVGGAERSPMFFRWLLHTFTNERDVVLDIFAGCGGLGHASQELRRHYLGIDNDTQLVKGPLTHFT